MKFTVNVDPKEVTQVAITMKLMNMAIYGGSIFLCHRIHPLQKLDLRFLLQDRLKLRFPTLHQWGRGTYDKTTQFLIHSKLSRRMLSFMRLNPDTFVHTAAEGTILYKCAMPVILPVTFFSAVRLTSWGNNKKVQLSVEPH